MEYIVEEIGSTVEEAVEKGLAKLGIDREYVNVEVVEQKKGFLGILKGGVRVRIKPVVDERLLYAKRVLEDIFSKVGMDVRVGISVDGTQIDVDGNEIGLVIGYHGKRLMALQYIVNFLVRKEFSSKRGFVSVDAGGYKEKRRKFLVEMAKDVALDVRILKRRKYLPPMLSWERKIVHLTVAGIKGVKTVSVGKEPNRRVCIFPQK